MWCVVCPELATYKNCFINPSIFFRGVITMTRRLDSHTKAMRAEERKRWADIRRAQRWEERRTWKAIQHDVRPGRRDYK